MRTTAYMIFRRGEDEDRRYYYQAEPEEGVFLDKVEAEARAKELCAPYWAEDEERRQDRLCEYQIAQKRWDALKAADLAIGSRPTIPERFLTENKEEYFCVEPIDIHGPETP